MMQITQPLWLWGLLALAVPVAIHLLSRKEGRVVPVGSLRHLRETTSQQFRGIRLNEYVLLALRLLLITLFVLLLSGLFWKNTERQLWVVVDRSIIFDPRAMALADSLVEKGYEWRWLEAGFPKESKESGISLRNNWQLIEKLHAQHLQHAVVLSSGWIKEFKGEYAQVGSNIDWQVIDLSSREEPIFSVEKAGNKLVRTVFSSPYRTHFVTDTINALPDSLQQVKPLRVALVVDNAFEEDGRLVSAALKSIASGLPLVIEIGPDQKDVDWLIWLSESSVPETTANVISIHPAVSSHLIEQQSIRHWQLRKRLTVDVAIENDFSIQLASLLTKDVGNPMSSSFDIRVLPKNFLKKNEVKAASVMDTEFNVPLLILFLLTLVGERVVAFVRKQ